MSITDELRRVAAKTECANGRCEKLYRGDLDHIADRIDAEHERECKEQYAIGAEHGIGASIEASMIQTHGYIELPKDADGVPYRIGDKVDSDHYEDGTVIGIHYFRAPNGVVFEEIAVQPNGWDVATWRDPEEYTHHHAPTVEDVLREFAQEMNDNASMYTSEAIDADEWRAADKQTIAEYAQRLQLREVDE